MNKPTKFATESQCQVNDLINDIRTRQESVPQPTTETKSSFEFSTLPQNGQFEITIIFHEPKTLMNVILQTTSIMNATIYFKAEDGTDINKLEAVVDVEVCKKLFFSIRTLNIHFS